MMTRQTQKAAPYDAAEAFYGQSELKFEEQLRLMGATDPRLLKAFKRTRERYAEQKRSKNASAN